MNNLLKEHVANAKRINRKVDKLEALEYVESANFTYPDSWEVVASIGIMVNLQTVMDIVGGDFVITVGVKCCPPPPELEVKVEGLCQN